MNIQNISSLTNQLESLGFEDVGYMLLKRVSFKPNHFSFSLGFDKYSDKLKVSLYFEKCGLQDEYKLVYYDAILQVEFPTTAKTVNGVDVVALESKMSSIDWASAFDFNSRKQLKIDDQANYDSGQNIEETIIDLAKLEETEEGKILSSNMKLKYWSGLPYQEIFGTITAPKNKSDIIQRFYVSEGQPGISIAEAYRFLQNRLLEKQIQLKRKDASINSTEVSEEDGQANSGGLLKKKRLDTNKKSTRKNAGAK